ncbi:HAD family hydrolase [Streptomyces californicus]|uniref:HAD family hydrolase n=1 Tax=Streptomyces californicus TaxID=67351 RepID=A0ABD7D5F2_9ACTN|nr:MULTISPECIES: HAD family hydrolase [Streptomyces]QRV28442.1 HAD family hydrolase [Streptomyces californicus]QRV35881.1 HAD family hydrolase [Streptomyces californicus]QRV41840.1 HAD family hydrolase [Streptomyces californicus]QRV48609.1 HAD family hydrolase [Streptomyces californicus]
MKTFVFDIGETLVRDDRYWGSWADWLGTPRHTLSALVSAVTARGLDNSEALRLVRPGIDISAEYAAREAAGCGEYLDESDLYEDVRPALAALRRLGMRVVVAGNQTVRAGELLRALELPADLVTTSQEWGCAKPSEEFFAKVLKASGASANDTVYVGDHPANDTFPAAKAGLRTAHIRRGPWGRLWGGDSTVHAAADWVVQSLEDLVEVVAKERN